MGNSYRDRQKDGEKGDVICSSKNSHKSEDQIALQISGLTLAKGGKPGKMLILRLIQSEPRDKWIQELFVKRTHGLGINIPKQLVSLEERYLKRCMELIHMNALQGAPCAISVNLNSVDTGFVSNHTMFRNNDSVDVPESAIDYPVGIETGNLVLSRENDDIVGSIMGSNSMMSILSSPLFQKLGEKKILENKRCVPRDNQGSRPSRDCGDETAAPMKQGYGFDSVQRSPISESSEGFLADEFSASSSSQGMLQFTWDNGLPHFVFSLDDQKEVYVASAGKDEKALDYVYFIHFKSKGRKLSDISDNESDVIGKIKVSSSFSLFSDKFKVLETEFVLVATNDNHARELHTFSRNSRRSRKISNVMEMFKQRTQTRTPSIFGARARAVAEDISEDRCLENDFLPNLELAALVVKERIQNDEHRQQKVGEGWGLKFLMKGRVKPTGYTSSDVSMAPCSTSVDIVVPACPHGGPRTRNGGPSSLIERWRSRGHCDCGGWDLGCPLKVLKPRSRSNESWPNSEIHGDCKSFDIFTEGLKQRTPTLKMVNIRDGLYFISFQSSLLSALQTFAIAVATVHSKCPSLRPKHMQD
ncbi:hypothetical protein RND81_14G136100 [Saponaria officinalis]|uniref:Uncharacterized protein n=1 Tax=Saponaria officinalis TaxID=3572 RepID=A0AAW1GXM1_SAPOF